MNQSIIVYRNPLEQAIWESNAPFIMIVLMIVTVATALVVDAVCKKFVPRKFYQKYSGYIVGSASAVVAIATIAVLV